jgi:Dolichyl-phosphate-mannose-protein mannosyltransferase
VIKTTSGQRGSPQKGGAFRKVRGAHPDWLLGGGIALLALVVRLAFFFRAPPLLEWRDSASYALPALGLLDGSGFAPELKRPPLYPLFLAASFWLVGEDLRGPLLLQHLLGAMSAGLTYALAGHLWGRAAGVLAGVPIALNGGLIFLEQSIMAESLFTFLLLGAVLAGAAARGARRPNLWALAAGALLGLATLTRPGTFALAVPLALALAWLAPGTGRGRLAVGGLVLLGCLGTVLPWTARNGLVHGTFTVAGGLGEALIYRTRHADRGFVYREPANPAGEGADPRVVAARRWVYRQLPRTDQSDLIYLNVQRDFGLSEAEADRLLRDIAVEGIRQDPGRYLRTTADMAGRLFLGWDRPMGSFWEAAGKRKFQEQWGERAAHLLGPPTPAQERELGAAEGLLNVYDHYRVGGLLAGLFVLGTAATLFLARCRPALPSALAVLVVLGLNVAVSGPISRHRISVEPLILVVGLGGLVALWELARAILRARPAWRGLPRRAAAPR